MDKVSELLVKGKDVADAFCTSPPELIAWMAGAALVFGCAGFLAGRLTAAAKQTFGRQ